MSSPTAHRTPRSVRIAASALVVAGVMTLTACSSDDEASGPTKVDVTLKEWSFTPDRSSAPAGPVTFSATNDGKEVHELVLFKTDLAPADLPLDQDGAVDERGEGLTLVDEVEDVKSGETKEFTADLEPGEYMMACNVIENGEVHIAHKMYHRFTVT
jgi:hypothetical protein